jgi:hypothetical protein
MFVIVAASGALMLADVRSGVLRGVHEGAGIVLAVAGLVHFAVNWKAFSSLFRHRRTILGCALAAGLAVALFVASSNEGEHRRQRMGPETGSGLRMR